MVIQLPDDRRAVVSETGYESLRTLGPVMRLLTTAELGRLAGEAGLSVAEEREIPLPGGKRFGSLTLRR